ncbi:hypothetical protein [Cloacibacterium sp.]
MNSVVIQYIIIFAMLLAAGYSLYKVFRKNFTPKKFDSKRTHCDKDCGCS